MPLVADCEQFREVIINLLHNSAWAGRKGTLPEVRDAIQQRTEMVEDLLQMYELGCKQFGEELIAMAIDHMNTCPICQEYSQPF